MPRGVRNTASTTSYDTRIPIAAPFSMDSLMDGGPDILVAPAEADIRALCEDEKFLHEPIVIKCMKTGEMSPKVVEITVRTGGITGPARHDKETGEMKPGVAGRGGKRVIYTMEYDKPYTIPRFVFEALAHSKRTTLHQRQDPRNPMEMIHYHAHEFSYHIECLRDDNPKGQGWRERVLADPA